MKTDYSIEHCRRLADVVREAGLHYAHGPTRYDPGDTLDWAITGVCPATPGRARLEVERFIGGGFAGQVYRVRLLALELDGEPIPGLAVGGVYAVKIIVPPTAFSRCFRNAIFWAAYQGPFAAQVNPSAARAGVLWQKLFRRGARIRFGDERAVADTYATFFDPGLGSYGEINEWVDGRVWKFEIDERVTRRGKAADPAAEASREYLAKKRFMAGMTRLCHEMGAPEFARQYEWWTLKSQPNVLKRAAHPEEEDDPAAGLTAIDFRAGLALLPFLPMSPGDVPLIFRGLARGDLVQFDRGNLDTLRAFCAAHAAEFADLAPALDELSRRDPEYRASLPDITHHGLRPLYDRRLARSIKDGYVEGWRAQRLVDDEHAATLKRSFMGFWLFLLLGALPLLGRVLRRCWGHRDYRRHVWATLTDEAYFGRAMRARMARTLTGWLRAGRVGPQRVELYLRRPALFWTLRVFPGLLPLPGKWLRFLDDPAFAWNATKEAVLYPIRFYRDADFRVAWLTGEIEAGAAEGMLTAEEKERILSRVPDPFIQKYLKCVAVHVCTLPITQVISVMVAVWVWIAYGKTWHEGLAYAAAVLIVFQGLPISPGSLVRGAYVVYLIVSERNIRNYWLAALVSFWHYIGYLGFPLQMVAEFPALARFMAGRWATKMVNFIPVFGEHGALLEHWVFDVFFNLPLSIRRRFLDRRRQAATK